MSPVFCAAYVYTVLSFHLKTTYYQSDHWKATPAKNVFKMFFESYATENIIGEKQWITLSLGETDWWRYPLEALGVISQLFLSPHCKKGTGDVYILENSIDWNYIKNNKIQAQIKQMVRWQWQMCPSATRTKPKQPTRT